MPSRILAMLLISGVIFVTSAIDPPPAMAQLDANGFAEVPGEADPGEDDELIRQLESTASRGGAFRAQSIRSLARLKAWPEVNLQLAKLNTVTEQAELAEAAEIIGSEILLRISLQPDLSPASQSAVDKMSAASKALLTSQPRLANAITELATSDVDTNLRGTRTLLRGGTASIQAIVAAIAQGRINPGVQQRQLAKSLSILAELGDGGADALEQVALYGNPASRLNTMVALRLLEPEKALDSLVVAGFAIDATKPERDFAMTELNGQAPGMDSTDAIAFLRSRLRTLRKIAADTPNNSIPVMLWSIGPDGQSVTVSRSTQVFEHYRKVYDAAQRLRRIGGLPDKLYRDCVAADLAYRTLVDVDWGSNEQISAIRASYGERLDSFEVLQALDQARRRGDKLAALALIRFFAQLSVDTAGGGSIWNRELPGLPFMVDAARDSEPRIRYEAASLLAESGLINQQVPVPGQSYVENTLAEMSRLTSQAVAILLENRPEYSLRQENLLAQLGYRVIVVSSASEAEQAVQQGGDVQMLVSKIRISDATATELVDRVRRLPRGKQIPILFFDDGDADEKSVAAVQRETISGRWENELTPSVRLVSLPGSTAAMAPVLREVAQKRRLPALSASDRLSYQRIANGFFANRP